MGIRATAARVEALSPRDDTLHGTYWFDLRTRRPFGARMKRMIDVAGALMLIVGLAPLMLLVLLLVKLTSKGPAVFVQRRIGFRCNEFGMYKFRTMVANAQQLEAELKEGIGSEYFKLQRDPRVTPVGRFLRRYSLDELPQFFNVLEGTMSLVGPRPLLVSDLERLPIRGQMRRFSVRPGITGLWQVSGRSSTTDEQRMQLDRDYINNWSLWLDVKILARTIGAVLSGRGAV
jgi:lipopolysaccharide/colanic/teichoic acid biosynthesis glycosyltransferase